MIQIVLCAPTSSEIKISLLDRGFLTRFKEGTSTLPALLFFKCQGAVFWTPSLWGAQEALNEYLKTD